MQSFLLILIQKKISFRIMPVSFEFAQAFESIIDRCDS